MSIGTKFEENDLTGSSFNPAPVCLTVLDDQNINVLWAAYSHAHRQPSLSRNLPMFPAYGRVFLHRRSLWSNIQFEANTESLIQRKWMRLSWMEKSSVGKFSRRIFLYHYDTKDAVLASQTSVNAYEPNDVQILRGELVN